MPTHEYWQFSYVKDQPSDTLVMTGLGSTIPLRVEHSNFPTGSKPSEFVTPSEVVQGDHIRVFYLPLHTLGMGTIPAGYANTGRFKILKKLKEFPRSHSTTTDPNAIEVLDKTDFGSTDYILYLDHNVGNNKSTWYYTIFYELTDLSNNTNKWAYSPIYGHGRAFALEADSNKYGNKLYKYFPSGIRSKDAREGNYTLERLCKILGRAFDEIFDRLSCFEDKRFDPDTVDAAFLPYIDQLLGWPTNFELREGLRREETSNILSVWRSKGTNNSFALALQEVTGWSIAFEYGYNYTLTTATAEDVLDPNNPPNGWDNATDGVWADLVNAKPFNGTWTSSYTFTSGGRDNTIRNIYDGSSWQNTYGLLIRLLGSVASNALSEQVALDKINRLVPYLAMHYVNYATEVS